LFSLFQGRDPSPVFWIGHPLLQQTPSHHPIVMPPTWPPQSCPIQLLPIHSDLTFNTIIPPSTHRVLPPNLSKSSKNVMIFSAKISQFLARAEIIGDLITQIAGQDVMDLWESGSGGSTHVFMSMLMMCRCKFNRQLRQATRCSQDHQA
jgi:hypothetical protein